jgi:hypothetical protein
MLRNLPCDLNEWAVHPARATNHWQAIEPTGWQVRQTDYEFLTSRRARQILDQEGITVIDYRPLQKGMAGDERTLVDAIKGPCLHYVKGRTTAQVSAVSIRPHGYSLMWRSASSDAKCFAAQL